MTLRVVRKPRVPMVEKAGHGPGVSVHEATTAAAAQVEALREDVTARIDTIVVRFGTLRAGTEPAADPGELRRLADELAGLCGAFGSPEMGGVASSLCRLIDLAAPRVASHAAVSVHLDALHLFARTEPHARAAMAKSVLAGLTRVVSANEA